MEALELHKVGVLEESLRLIFSKEGTEYESSSFFFTEPNTPKFLRSANCSFQSTLIAFFLYFLRCSNLSSTHFLVSGTSNLRSTKLRITLS